MALCEITPTSTPKGSAAMLQTLPQSPGSPAPDMNMPALKIVETPGAAGGAELTTGEADTSMRLMLAAGKTLAGKTLGIVGFGQAGRETARRAHLGFGMNILVCDHSPVPDEELDKLHAGQADDIDHLLVRSDFVSLHCPADPANRHLIDALRLNRMKPDAYLINSAGHQLVDEEALADALWYHTIAGAGLGLEPGRNAMCDRLLGCENLTVLHAAGNPQQ